MVFLFSPGCSRRFRAQAIPLFALLLCAFSTPATLSAQNLFSLTKQESRAVREKVIAEARTYIGVPYVSGGTSRNGIDCSGLIHKIVKDTTGVAIQRTVATLYSNAEIITSPQKEPGDLLFFKTVGDRISHVGLYIGNNQFIHAASDGPNTGVIISSLNESYWKGHFYCVGRIFSECGLAASSQASGSGGKKASGNSGASASANRPATASGNSAPNSSTGNTADNTARGTATNSASANAVTAVTLVSDPASDTTPATDGARPTGYKAFLGDLRFDAKLSATWTFLQNTGLTLSARGAEASGTAIYNRGGIHPGLGLALRYDAKAQVFQIPLTLNLETSGYLRFYFGPVFTIGTAVIPGTTKQIKPSVFPGIIGLSWQTPPLAIGNWELALVQDLSYTVFNNTDGAVLPFFDSISTGLTLNTGVRLTFPSF